jgi:hypothetical protein
MVPSRRWGISPRASHRFRMEPFDRATVPSLLLPLAIGLLPFPVGPIHWRRPCPFAPRPLPRFMTTYEAVGRLRRTGTFGLAAGVAPFMSSVLSSGFFVRLEIPFPDSQYCKAGARRSCQGWPSPPPPICRMPLRLLRHPQNLMPEVGSTQGFDVDRLRHFNSSPFSLAHSHLSKPCSDFFATLTTVSF